MKRYTYFHGLILSFFSKAFYKDVGLNWTGTGLLYIAVILALLSIPTVIKMQRDFAHFVDNEAPAMTNQIPAVKIKNGVLSTDVQTPYFIKNPDDGTPLAVIDTTGQYTSLDQTPATVLITKNKVIAKNRTETRIYDLSTVESFEIDRARVEGWLSTAKQWLILVVYPFAVLFGFIFRAVQILIYALIGMAFASMLHTSLNYQTLMRLAAVAITPVLVLDLLLEFLPFKIPLWTILGIGVALGYLFFAVKSNSETEPEPQYYAPPPPSQL